jgi:phosphohistidine phosphatase
MTTMTHTLVVIRHAKSDWSVPADDRDRPLAKRGRRQAPATGRWLASQGIAIDLAVVSPAARARQTWDLIAAELGEGAPRVVVDPAAYTFDGDHLLVLAQGLPEDVDAVALVGHNPAVEELVETLTGEYAALPTSALAILRVPAWASALPGSCQLTFSGRPADDRDR